MGPDGVWPSAGAGLWGPSSLGGEQSRQQLPCPGVLVSLQRSAGSGMVQKSHCGPREMPTEPFAEQDSMGWGQRREMWFDNNLVVLHVRIQ